ncbi:MAG: Gfo/Idh/MocA family protein [Salinibacter sp.]
MAAHDVALLGTGLIGSFYASALHGKRGRDRIQTVFSRTPENAEAFAEEWDVPEWTTDMEAAITESDTDVVVVGVPNFVHEEAVLAAADAGKAVLSTKPLGRTAEEARRMLEAVEEAGVFHGYLEDLVYTPKTIKALNSVQEGALGDILWVRSREAHNGPHSAWFWDEEKAGGGAIVDMGCHTIEIIRNFVGKNIRPTEVMCWIDTLVHPIEAEDHAVGMLRFENGAMGQFEVSWAFRGGMDLRDEVSGTEGSIRLNHWLDTGFDLFTSGASEGYVAEKAESESGWQFPVGDEPHALGYDHMFTDMLGALDAGETPRETFYDGYVVNAIVDACYASAESGQWEAVELEDWRGATETPRMTVDAPEVNGQVLIKEERMPSGDMKRILKNPETGAFSETVTDA